MSDRLLADILRRFIADQDTYMANDHGELTIDGWVAVSPEEATVVDRLRREAFDPPAQLPTRCVRVGETFDLAPGETVDVVVDRRGLGSMPLLRLSGGPGGMKGARIG